MRTLILAGAALAALAASPAMARDNTHISFGFYSPAPVVYQPTPVYYAPVHYARVAPHHRPCPPRHHARAHRHHHARDYSWNDWNYNRGYWSH